MAGDTLTVRLDPKMRESIDKIAAQQDRDRSYIVKEALRAYLELYQWQIEHIKKGMRSADEGRFASEEQVRETIARLTGKK
ncbi:MAG: ribbon-helix-helix protein, CopG family [Acidobacteriia bacterium]|nr:ribbon-helix-helix protein, CopG family [Terriglobia bacterium]